MSTGLVNRVPLGDAEGMCCGLYRLSSDFRLREICCLGASGQARWTTELLRFGSVFVWISPGPFEVESCVLKPRKTFKRIEEGSFRS